MAEALPFISISTLVVGVVTLVIAALIFRHSRRSAELAEDRMEYLREEQARLVFFHEERQSLAEELKREREQRLENQRQAERPDQKHLVKLEQEHRRLMEELEQERGQRLEAQRQTEVERQERLLRSGSASR